MKVILFNNEDSEDTVGKQDRFDEVLLCSGGKHIFIISLNVI